MTPIAALSFFTANRFCYWLTAGNVEVRPALSEEAEKAGARLTYVAIETRCAHRISTRAATASRTAERLGQYLCARRMHALLQLRL
jgi:hypothetical protein